MGLSTSRRLPEIQQTDDETRAYRLTCGYDAIIVKFKVPSSSYRYVEQLSVICQCHDGLGFPNGVAEAAAEANKTQAIDVLNNADSEHVHC
jgi:hypothetical protein